MDNKDTDIEYTKAILNAIYGFKKVVSPKYDVIITLLNGCKHKANDTPILMSEVTQLLLHLTKPTIYGKYIIKFEVIQTPDTGINTEFRT